VYWKKKILFQKLFFFFEKRRECTWIYDHRINLLELSVIYAHGKRQLHNETWIHSRAEQCKAMWGMNSIYIYIYICSMAMETRTNYVVLWECWGRALVVAAVVSINKIIIKRCPLFLMPKIIMEIKLCQGWLCNYIDSKDDSWLSTSA
jgi:hypothetical protein